MSATREGSGLSSSLRCLAAHDLLCRSVKLGAGLLGVVSMDLHQPLDVKAGCSEDLDLADVGALQRVDALACLLNVLACTKEPTSLKPSSISHAATNTHITGQNRHCRGS